MTNELLYGFFGLSVWVVTTDAEFAALCAGKLRAARTLVLMHVADVPDTALTLWDTGQTPHFDAVSGDGSSLDELVSRFLAVPHEIGDDESYDPEGGDR